MTIAILGEAWGEAEERERVPFVGASGYELTRMLAEADIRRADCFLTNVFNRRPRGNRIEDLCGPKSGAIPGYPYLIKGQYVRAEFQGELNRLAAELMRVDPDLIICLGNTACWAMLGKTVISKLRGTTDLSNHTASGFKCLPTYHPAAVLRQWELRPIVIVDLMKAKRESEYPEIRRPKREIWIEPTIEDMERFRDEYILGRQILSVDIETAGERITCIGFAPDRSHGLVIPFVNSRRKGRSYWDTKKDELRAWAFVKSILEDRSISKLFQNGLYDIAFIWRTTGIKIYGAEHDTMLLQHALQPESLKGLGFLGSVYTDEGAWKGMRKVETIKAED